MNGGVHCPPQVFSNDDPSESFVVTTNDNHICSSPGLLRAEVQCSLWGPDSVSSGFFCRSERGTAVVANCSGANIADIVPDVAGPGLVHPCSVCFRPLLFVC